MSKNSTNKTLTNTKIYLQYLDESGDKITLSFRNVDSMKSHINKYKILKSRIISIANERPINKESLSILKTVGKFVSYRYTSKRGVANG